MRKFITFLILTVIFSSQLTTEVYSAAGLQHFFKGIVRFFKGSADDVMKSGDDLLKNMGKTREEILSGSKNKPLNETISSSSVEAKISETIGKEQHSLNFTTLKNTTRPKYIKKLKSNIGVDDAADLFDFEDLITDSKSGSTNKGFYSVIILNWVGKIYRNSDYYSKPNLEEKMLLVCRTDSDVFYFSLLMEQEPKRAFLVEHKKLNKTNIKTMVNQELVVLEDSNDVKIMSSFPEKGNEFKAEFVAKDEKYRANYRIKEAKILNPGNSISYNNQGFEYENTSLSFDTIKFKSLVNIDHKNNCFKATNEGLL